MQNGKPFVGKCVRCGIEKIFRESRKYYVCDECLALDE